MTVLIFLALAVLSARLPAFAASCTFELDVDAAVPRRAPVFMVQQGDEVALCVESKSALDVHLHGYDVAANVSKMEPATMRFVARASGRFPIEIHSKDGRRVVGYIEVRPR